MYTITTTDGRTVLREAADTFWLSQQGQWITTSELQPGDTVLDAITRWQITIRSLVLVQPMASDASDPSAGLITASTSANVHTLPAVAQLWHSPAPPVFSPAFKKALSLTVRFHTTEDEREGIRIRNELERSWGELTDDEVSRIKRVVGAISDDGPPTEPVLAVEPSVGPRRQLNLRLTYLSEWVVAALLMLGVLFVALTTLVSRS